VRIPLLVALLATCCLAAGEAPTVLNLTLPDLARTRTRLAAGPFKGLWDQPAVQRLRGMVPAGDLDPAWWTLADRLAELRLVVSSTSPPEVRCGLRLPDGPLPAVTATATARVGAWWLLGNEPLTAAPAAAPGDAQADLRLLVDLRAIAAAMNGAERASYTATLDRFGLGRIEATATATPGGFHDVVRLPGCRLPLRALDPAALAGLPDALVTVTAVGIDGAALVRVVKESLAGGWVAADAACSQQFGLGLEPTLAALDGTAVFVLTPGVPLPGLTVSLPANPGSDALVTALLGLAVPAGGAQLVAEARQRAVLVPLPDGARLPLMLQLRRSATRWILSSDLLLIEQLATPPAGAAAPGWMPPPGALACNHVDNRAWLQLLAASIGMAGAAVQQANPAADKALIPSLQQALSAAAAVLPPSRLAVTRTGDGLLIEGDNNLVGQGPILAGLLLPAISMVRESARKANAGSNLRQLCLASIAYTSENDGAWPRDLAHVKQWADGELTDKLFRFPGHEEIAAPFLYVRPDKAAKARQPVLITDPACMKGRASIVCYADGHIATVPGTALWEEGLRLSSLPVAAGDGIPTAAWDAVIDTTTGQRRRPAP